MSDQGDKKIGRPALPPEEKMVPVSVRLNLSQRDKLKRIGVQQLRDRLDKVCEIEAQRQEKDQEINELIDRVSKARELLRRCDAGFGAFIMGRRMARKERDKLREDIQRWMDGRA